MTTENLWENIPKGTKIDTPKKIIQDQGKILTDSTAGDLVVKIIEFNEQGQFTCFFRLTAPRLGQFSVDLFIIRYGIGFYPVNIETRIVGLSDYKCNNEEEYKIALRTIFNNEAVQNLIQKILTQIVSL